MAGNSLPKRHSLSLAVFAVLNFMPAAHAVSTNIVISEFRTRGPNGGNDEFVELYNLSNNSVDISGWKINGSSSTGATGTRATIAAGTVLAPGCRFLATNSAASGYSGAVVGDQTYSTGIADSGGVAVLTASNVVIDAVGMSATSAYKEGTVLAQTTSNANQSQERNAISQNNQDTDDNASDFTLNSASSSPQNLSSACTPISTTPSVNLSVSSTAASEAGATVVTVTATASAAVTGNETVSLTVSGTGITADDYSLSNAVITIPGGSTSGSVTFTVVDDTLAEGTETASLSISNPSGGITLGAITSQNISIADNELAAVPTLTVSDVSRNEGNGGISNYVFNVGLSAPAPAGGVTFDIATADASATAGSDYASQNLTGQTIPAGSSNSTFTVPVNGDTVAEADETFLVNVSNVSGATLTGGQAIGTIINDDAVNACGTPATKISAVQGNGASTPLGGVAGTTIEGIVVGDYQGSSANSLRGFFVEEEDADADGDPATSEGIFVFDGTTALANVSVGDRVRVTGTPAEFFNMTQLGTITDVQVCANSQAIPTAATLTLPVPNVPNGNLTTATDVINAYYEKMEGMLVTIPATLKVSEYFELERFGQLILSQGGRIPTFTSVSNPSPTGLINQNITLAKRQIILDDGNNVQNYALNSGLPLPYPSNGLSTTNRFRGGDTIANLSGVLHWSFAGATGTDAWRIRPVEALFDYTFSSANPRKPLAPELGGSLKVASFNVLNYFTTVDNTVSDEFGDCSGGQDCRGADSAAELARQTAKAAAALCGMNADILGLMEIENNATASLSALVGAANAISGCGPYHYVDTGAIGTDAIKVGLLYKTSTVNPEGSFQLLTSSDDARFIDTKNRPTLAQTFKQISSGEKLTVAVNHLKSKRPSGCTDAGDVDANDGQGSCNLTRKNAAMALVDWLNNDPTGSGDPDYLIIGDLNSYAKEDPIKAIENGPDDTTNTGDDYTNLVKAFAGESAYSYVFDGQTGYLDHALASSSLRPQVTNTSDWHINADEVPSFDYNDTIADVGEASFEAKPAALPLYAADQYRTSDHDPVIVGLQLGETINIVNGTAAKNILNGTTGKDRISGLGSADTLTGGLNDDEFVYVGVSDGIDTIIDFTLGEDKIVLTALLQSLGYQGADPLADGIVKFAASGNDTVVYIDADGAGPAVQRALILVRGVLATGLNNAVNFIF